MYGTSTIEKLDRLAGIDAGDPIARLLERAAFVFLLLMVAAAPHSIAATQTAWGIGMLATLLRFVISPRPRLRFRAIDAALLALAGWSVITCAFSYEPAVSFNRLRGVGLFLIFYFAVWNLRNLRSVYLAAFLLIVSCCVNLVWTPVERAIGRGVEIHDVDREGALGKALLIDGDTLLKADRTKLTTPDDLIAALSASDSVKVLFYRPDFEFAVDVKSSHLRPGATANERLGIGSWKESHNWRSKGFYNHYVTYAEVLQLIAALIFGLLAAAIRTRRRTIGPAGQDILSRVFTSSWFLAAALGLACLALLFTVTRASQLGFVVAAFAIVSLTASRKFAIAAVLVAVPVIVGGLIFLQQSRQVGFLDSKDDSTKYRLMMWRDGARILTDSPRHLAVGVGMDSIQRHWQEWGMFDGGRQPMGHFHSMPLQLAVERGLPAAIIWIVVLVIFAASLWKAIRKARDGDWRTLGVLLGAFGAIAGFFTSGLVHSNLIDAEVAMVFYILMALGVSAARLAPDEAAPA